MKNGVQLILAVAVVFLVRGTAAWAESPVTNCIAIVNAAGIDAATLEQIRAVAQKELSVTVRSSDSEALKGKTAEEMTTKLIQNRKPGEVCTIAFISAAAFTNVVTGFDTNRQVAIINVKLLLTNDTNVYVHRLQRQVLRSAAFLFGLQPALDPFCVTRNYRSLADLDSMAIAFVPPWKEKFLTAARKRGLEIIEVGSRLPHTPK